MYFKGFFKERLIFKDFFAQLKWSGRVYMLTAVSGLTLSLGLHLDKAPLLTERGGEVWSFTRAAPLFC